MTAVVVGAGAAGATAALALRKVCASEVVLYERAQDPATHQGWVTLGPTAMTALDTIGVAEAVAAVGFAVEEVVFITGDERSVLPRREPGHKYSSTHVWRRNLLAVLRERLDGAIRYEPAPPVGELVAAPDVDLIVGADGAHSLVRRYLGDVRPLHHVGESIVYGRQRRRCRRVTLALGPVLLVSPRRRVWLCVRSAGRHVLVLPLRGYRHAHGTGESLA